jgi:hypothetical protein
LRSIFAAPHHTLGVSGTQADKVSQRLLKYILCIGYWAYRPLVPLNGALDGGFVYGFGDNYKRRANGCITGYFAGEPLSDWYCYSPIRNPIKLYDPYSAEGYAKYTYGVWNAIQAQGGEFHSLALTQDGKVYAWGSQPSLQVTGDLASDRTAEFSARLVSAPLLLSAGGVRAIAAGRYHSLALGIDGVVYGWGASNSSELGVVDATGQGVAARVVANAVPYIAISAGPKHSLALSCT